MEDYYKRKYEELKKKIRFQCPKCRGDGRVIEFPDYRYSNCGEYTVKCTRCGHHYGVRDDCTG